MEEQGQNYGSQRPAPPALPCPALPGLRAQRRPPGAVVPPQPRLCGQGAAPWQSHPKIVFGCWWKVRRCRSAAGARCPPCGSGAGGGSPLLGARAGGAGPEGAQGIADWRGSDGEHSGCPWGAQGAQAERLGVSGMPSLGGLGGPGMEGLAVHKLGVPRLGRLGVLRLGGSRWGTVGCPCSGVQSVQDARTRGGIRVPRPGGLSHIPASPASAGGGASGAEPWLCPHSRPGQGHAGRALRADPSLGSVAGSGHSPGTS